MSAETWVILLIASNALTFAITRWVYSCSMPELPVEQIKRGINKVGLQPFSKPSGKRSPKVNDDVAGWRKENDLP